MGAHGSIPGASLTETGLGAQPAMRCEDVEEHVRAVVLLVPGGEQQGHGALLPERRQPPDMSGAGLRGELAAIPHLEFRPAIDLMIVPAPSSGLGEISFSHSSSRASSLLSPRGHSRSTSTR